MTKIKVISSFRGAEEFQRLLNEFLEGGGITLNDIRYSTDLEGHKTYLSALIIYTETEI